MSVYKWQASRLSAVQIRQLCMLAGRAHKAAKLRGDPLADVDAETYRKNGQDEATETHGLSLKEATQLHYLPIRGYWWVILGNAEQAFWDFMNSGEQSEAARQLKWRLSGEVSRLAEGIQADKARLPVPVVIAEPQALTEAWNYTHALSRDKFGRGTFSLSAEELKQLCDTVFNRASAKLRVGNPDRRNKSQRQKQSRRSPIKAPEEPLEPFCSDRTTAVAQPTLDRLPAEV